MAVRHGYGKSAGADALVFAYDTGDTRNSYKGEPTVNYVPGTYAYSLYAYASGPVNTTVLNENSKSITAKRYTITNTVNTARAAIYPSGLTTGVAYTFSFKWKYNGTTTASPGISVSAAKGNPEGGANNNGFTSTTSSTVAIGNGWYLTTYTFVFSSNPTGACMLTFGISTGSNTSYLGETFDIYEAQFEIKNHRTPFVNGTRSATQGLLDLTGNSTVDVSYVSFDGNAQMTFDGTNDGIDLGAGYTYFSNKSFCLETIIKPDTSPPVAQVFFSASGPVGGLQKNIHFRVYDYGALRMGFYSNDLDTSNGVVTFGQYHHIVMQYNFDLDTSYIYLNGVLLTSGTQGPFTDSSAQIGVGFWYGVGQYFKGEIPVTKVYNRVLTAAEVKNNYNNYKGRFNI